MNDLIAKIRVYLNILNKNIAIIDQKDAGLIDFCINEVIDRVQLYLNSDIIPNKLERILAGVVNNGIKKCLKDIDLSQNDISSVDKAITSIGDNGQSISYTNEVTNYFTTASDNDLFTGFSSLLNRYRRIKVVYPKVNDKNNI